MHSVSSDFITASKAKARQILVRAYFNGDTLLTGDNLIDLTITESTNTSEGLSMGAAIASKLTMTIKMPEIPLLLSGSSVRPEVAYFGVDEWVPLGVFYVTDAVSKDDFETTVTITAYDGFSKTERPYEPSIAMPNTAAAILADIAAQCGLAYNNNLPNVTDEGVYESGDTADISADGVIIFSEGADVTGDGVLTVGEGIALPPGEFDLLDLTCRQYIGYFAGLLGCNARFNRNGELAFSWYTDAAYTIGRDAQYMGGCKRLTEKDFTVHSITSGYEGNEMTAGTGVGISFENPFMSQEILDGIYARIGAPSFTPMQVKWRGNPAIEAGDIVTVEDNSGTMHAVYIMEQTIKVSGGLYSEIKCFGSSDEDIAFSTSPTEKKLQKVYTKLQEAIAEATKLLNGASGGVFEIIDEDGDGINDGWIIHSADGDRFIKANLNGIGLTRDGGATYDQAITPAGINADVITVGHMSAQRISVGDKSLGDVFSVDLDDEGHPVVTIGASNSDIVQKQTNDAVSFVSGDETVAKFSITGAEWKDMQQMKYCGFIWAKSSITGNVRFTKAEEE